jgi:hypothetical protein
MVQPRTAGDRGRRLLAVLLAALGCTTPAALGAPGEGHGEFEFTGIYRGGGQVQVTESSPLALQHGLLGATTTLVCVDGAILVADLNGDGAGNLADVQPGDAVTVITEQPLANPLSSCYAKALIDRTHPAE